MKLKYNMALIPSNFTQFIELSKLFSNIADSYLLGTNSLPHVTLVQFYAEEKELNTIWKNTCEAIDKKSISLQFNEFSYITFDKKTYWLSLLPNHIDELNVLHRCAANIIKHSSTKHYDPHLTLINTGNSEYQNEVDKFLLTYKPLSDNFMLSLGKCDDIGQYTEILKACDITQKHNHE